MEPKPEPSPDRSEQPPARRKSKPKFEVPVETGSAAAGWVYRDANAETREFPAVRLKPEHIVPSKADPQLGPLLNAGIDLFTLGFTTIGRLSMTLGSVMTAPVRIMRRLLISD